MNFIRKFIPDRLKQLILEKAESSSTTFSPLFQLSRISASFWYFLFSRKFDREHQAVLAGKVAYHKELTKIGHSSILLRRNIHRIEKGLIMQPRRNTFAEGFIRETVEIYKRAIEAGSLDSEERKWSTDVLSEYFSVVKDTDIILESRNIFEAHSILSTTQEKKYIPYPFDTLTKTDISYEQLNKLFIKRRSVRWYQDKEVPMELIAKAVNLASLAPSACNRQPYTFYVSENKTKAVQMAKCAGGTPGWVDNIPSTIAIIGDLSAYPAERDRHVIYIDGSLAAMQLILAFETLGISTCSINWPDIESAEKKMQKLLNLKIYERPIMLLSIGYAEDKGGIPYSQKKKATVLMKGIKEC